MIYSLFDASQNKSQQHSDDPEMKQELKKTKSKLQQYESAMKTMEEELSQKNKELEHTKAQVSLLNKKVEDKQFDTSEDKHVDNAAIKDNKKAEQTAASVTNSQYQLKNKSLLQEQKVSHYFEYVKI